MMPFGVASTQPIRQLFRCHPNITSCTGPMRAGFLTRMKAQAQADRDAAPAGPDPSRLDPAEHAPAAQHYLLDFQDEHQQDA